MRAPSGALLAWLGPAIGPQAYEVGEEVRAAFLARDAQLAAAFAPNRPGHWLLDLYAVARQRLAARGVTRVYGGGFCTYSEPERFPSWRRDRAPRAHRRLHLVRIALPVTLTWIVLASIAGGLLSVCAAAFALVLRAAWVPMLVSFAIGTLLGAAFLEVIPHAFEQGEPHRAASAILGGILGFFVLEKLLLWRHSHEHGERGRAAPPPRALARGAPDRGRRHRPQLRRRRADRRGLPAEPGARPGHRDRHHRARDPAGSGRLPDPAALGLLAGPGRSP